MVAAILWDKLNTLFASYVCMSCFVYVCVFEYGNGIHRGRHTITVIKHAPILIIILCRDP